MVEPTCVKFNKWKQAGIPVKIVRCDNGGENVKLEKRSKSAEWKLNLTFEYTARSTPQQNSLAEVGFTTIGNQGLGMMIAANIGYAMRFLPYCEAYACATMLDGLVLKELDGVTCPRVEHWCGHLPAWAKAVRTWGEAGVVTLKSKTSPKLANKGLTCMFVGYATGHADGVYRMWNPTTGGVHVSRDVVWLKRMYYQRVPTALEIATGVDREVRESDGDFVTRNTTPTVNTSMKVGGNEDSNVSDDDNVSKVSRINNSDGNEHSSASSSASSTSTTDASETGQMNQTNSTIESYRQMSLLLDDDKSGSVQDEESSMDSHEETEPEVTITRSGRASRQPRWMANYAVLALTKSEMQYQAMLKDVAKAEVASADFRVDHKLAGVGAGLGGGFGNTMELKPMKLNKAMATDAVGWIKAVEEEHERMLANDVWSPVKRSMVPKGAKILTSTWACKLKSNGTKRVRINGRGYEQVDGVHYDSASIHSPVTNDVSVHIVMVLALMANWDGKISDVKGAFLKGSLDPNQERMFMHIPQGFEEYYEEDEVL